VWRGSPVLRLFNDFGRRALARTDPMLVRSSSWWICHREASADGTPSAQVHDSCGSRTPIVRVPHSRTLQLPSATSERSKMRGVNCPFGADQPS
jgi:hypothetical protein